MINPKHIQKLKHQGNQLAFNAIMALHEFERDENAVVNILKMKKNFSYFIL